MSKKEENKETFALDSQDYATLLGILNGLAETRMVSPKEFVAVIQPLVVKLTRLVEPRTVED